MPEVSRFKTDVQLEVFQVGISPLKALKYINPCQVLAFKAGADKPLEFYCDAQVLALKDRILTKDALKFIYTYQLQKYKEYSTEENSIKDALAGEVPQGDEL